MKSSYCKNSKIEKLNISPNPVIYISFLCYTSIQLSLLPPPSIASMASLPIQFLLLLPLLASSSLASSNPFTEKAALIRYWNRKIPNNLPHPAFLLSKLTPLSASAASTFRNLASTDPTLLSSHLPSFCSSANLLCPSPDLHPSLSSRVPSAFKSYQNSNFTNYISKVGDGVSSFTNYSEDVNVAVDTFRRYLPRSVFNTNNFTSYVRGANIGTANFTSYGSDAAGGSDNFAAYSQSSNDPELKFTTYASDGDGHNGNFNSYSVDANGGDQSFSGYAKHGNGELSEFSSYANNSNVVGSTFGHYSEGGNGGNSTFSSYGENGNVPENNFKSYGELNNGGFDRFTSYRDQSNVGDNFFTSYEKTGNDGTAEFTNYGNSANPGSDNFKGYDDQITFKEYFSDNTTFKSYANTSVIDFKGYHNSSTTSTSSLSTTATEKWIEPGKFFRERSLRKGVVMPMPDIRDRTAPRSFLPRSISGKIPFSAAAVDGIFRIIPDTAMGKAVESTVADCERPPSSGETKRCAASAEDMIDFAVEVLGGDIQVRSTAAVTGSKNNILIGNVRGVNGGKVTESVSCHQSLFPYLVYYCHSVPRVRVYVADILAVDSKEKINEGVAICHLDTSDWSAGHGAFVALGPGPGKIEVCHWIFEGDMTWTIADRT